jgi:hypothetical protein
LHLAVAPVGSVLLAASVGADLVAVEFLAALDEVVEVGAPEAGTGAEVAAGVLLPGVDMLVPAVDDLSFCTPP